MITRMSIRNFALIEQIVIPFHRGITIFTGETGAGKSILMDAFSILLGERASSEYIRHEKDHFLIEGVFDITEQQRLKDLLESKNIEVEEDTLILSRSFNRQGKSNILANDQSITLKTLREIGSLLADIHGQYNNQDLLNPEMHHLYLDTYNHDAKEAYATYKIEYDTYKEAKRRLESLETEAAERARELDMLRFQIQEIEEASLKKGEDESISEELERMDHYETLHSTLTNAYGAIYYGRSPLIDGLSTVQSDVSDLVRYDESLESIAELLRSAYYQLEEAGQEIDRYKDSISYDEERYAYVQERDTVIYSLKRKYGDTIEAVLAFKEQAQERLDYLENLTFAKADLESSLKETRKKAEAALQTLKEVREDNQQAITVLLQQELAQLGMKKARLEFLIEPCSELNSLGAEQIELLFSANTGEGLLPLSKVASGGEISRIALAFKSVFNLDNFKTLVFDEIDVGISGDVALQVAKQILGLSSKNQVFCITHLPQTASIAEHHYHLEKEERDGRTVSTLRILDYDEHIEQIARIMSGQNFSSTAIETAKEMVEYFNVEYTV